MASCPWLIVSLALGPVINAQLDTSVCRQTASDHSGPSLPTLPEQFTIRVEANLLNKNTTIDVREWHDGPGNRGAASMWVSSVQLAYLFSYATNEQFTVGSEGEGRYSCQVSALDTGKEPYLYGTAGNNSSNNSNNSHNGTAAHIYTAAQALSFGGSISEHYVGRSRVRGMVTDHWSSCVYWPGIEATMTVHWYFSVGQEWDTAVGVGRVPVRCRVEGKVREDPNSPRLFSHLYEITEFFSYLDGAPQVFETPAGTVCPGRKTTKPVPTMPNRVSYSSEVIDTNARTTKFTKKAYDNQLRLVMMEEVSPLPPHARLRTLDDFNTGARYTMDLTRGNCTISPILPSDFDAIHDVGASLRMRTPQEFFFGSDPSVFNYEGRRTMGEVNTEVWLGKLQPPSSLPSTPQQIWEYYFTSPEWEDEEEGGKEWSGRVPVSIRVASEHQEVHEIHNLYNFRDDDPMIWDYDVTSCYQDDQQFRQLDFFFPVTSSQFLAVFTNQNAFRRALLDSVTSLVTMSPVRVNKVELQFRREEVEVGMVLVEAVKMTSSALTSARQETSLVVAVARVMDAVTNRQLTVRLPTANGTMVLIASATSTRTTTIVNTPTTASTTTTTPTNANAARSSTTNANTARSSTTNANAARSSTTNANTARSSTTNSDTTISNATTSEADTKNLLCSPHSSGYTPGDVAGVAMGLAFAGYVLALVLAASLTRLRTSALLPPFHRDDLEMS